MSRFAGTMTPGNGKSVRRQGHAQRGIDIHTAGAECGVEVTARADGPTDVFFIYETDGYRTSQSRYARRLIGTVQLVDGITTFILRRR